MTVGDIFGELFGARPPADDRPRRAPMDAVQCARDTAAAVRQRPEPDASVVADALLRGAVELLRGEGRTVAAHLAVAPESLQVVRNNLATVRDELGAVVARSGYALATIEASARTPEVAPPEAPPRRIPRGEFVNAIAEAVATLKSYEVAEFCVRLGLEPQSDDDDDPHSSKKMYVRRKLGSKPAPELLDIGSLVLEELEAPDLERLLANARGGVGGNAKNLIFASSGPKPRIVLGDAINNDAMVVENEQFCLVYERPIPDSGVTWGALVAWYGETYGIDEGRDKALYERLRESLQPGPERLVLRVHAHLCRTFGQRIPALIPQVYLHYDPYTLRERGGERYLTRERMDFLMLLPGRRRVVIEVDGVQHYADDKKQAEPKRYADMVRADRELRLAGYEVFRFGGYEFVNEDAATEMLRRFFGELLGLADE